MRMSGKPARNCQLDLEERLAIRIGWIPLAGLNTRCALFRNKRMREEPFA
jgi:hypothetical protein